ncbi:MAG: FHA domain-containing protein [Clostridiales bacterium]|nr:FHA domain-containing protein [Clostridiales bacterium]
MKQCDKGHFYDDNRFESCPYCKDGTGLGKQAAVAFQSQPATQFQSAPVQSSYPSFKFCTKCGNRAEASAKFCTGCGNPFPAAAPAPSNDIGQTVAVAHPPVNPSSDIGKTVAVTPMSASIQSNDIGKTVALNTNAAPVTAPSNDIGKTVAVKPIDIEALTGSKSAVVPAAAAPVAPAVPAAPVAAVAPVAAASPVTQKPMVTVAPQTSKPAKTKPVAFLVCTAGNNLGDFYTVADGRNYIASGKDADIRLDKDTSVSAECHAVVTYNASNNKFTLSAGTGRGITYLNGEQIDVSSDLNADDKIKVGSSELLFIPVCSDNFKWDTQD